jgi:hypothetical protein
MDTIRILGPVFSVFVTKKKKLKIINRQAYESLLEEAYKKYGRETALDVYEVSWVNGKDYPLGMDYKATGKAVTMGDITDNPFDDFLFWLDLVSIDFSFG